MKRPTGAPEKEQLAQNGAFVGEKGKKISLNYRKQNSEMLHLKKYFRETQQIFSSH